MKKTLTTIFIICLLVAANYSCAKEEKEFVSTSGQKTETNLDKKLRQTTKAQDKEFATLQKNKKKYIKNVKRIKKLQNKKRLDIRDLEFYQKRLQMKQDLLNQQPNTQEVTKGEEE